MWLYGQKLAKLEADIQNLLGITACLSRCSRGDSPLVERYLEPGGLFPTMHGRVTILALRHVGSYSLSHQGLGLGHLPWKVKS